MEPSTTWRICGALRGDHNTPFFQSLTTPDCQTQTRSTPKRHFRAGDADLGSHPRRQRNRVITPYNTVHTTKRFNRICLKSHVFNTIVTFWSNRCWQWEERSIFNSCTYSEEPSLHSLATFLHSFSSYRSRTQDIYHSCCAIVSDFNYLSILMLKVSEMSAQDSTHPSLPSSTLARNAPASPASLAPPPA